MLFLDSSRWKPNGGKLAHFQCQECHVRRHASEFLICLCDSATQFIITGKSGGEPAFWNVEDGWMDGLEAATAFPGGIFGEKLPPGAEGLLELTFTGDHVSFYPVTLPRRGRGSKNL